MLEVCTTAEDGAGVTVPLASVREQIDTRFAEYSVRGQRTLGLARKRLGSEIRIGKDSEAGMKELAQRGECSFDPILLPE